MTKPGEKLILSYSDTNAKGEGISPAYLIGSIRSLYPKLEIENSYCYPENPEAGIDLFLEKLVQETEKEHEDILEQADETDANQRTLSARVWRRHYTERFHLTVLPDWNVLQPVHLHISFSME